MSLGHGRRTAALTLAVAAMATLVLGLGAGTASASSLRYFGYYAARITAAGGNHLPEVTARTNLNWVQISDPTRYAPEVLDSCAPQGCVVSTGFEFFEGCESVHSTTCRLYPNYAERWGRLADAVRSRIDKVGAFYLMDEPQWRGATPEELETVARTIKQTFPGVPVMMVEAGPQVSPTLKVPAAVDWVGFDWYCEPFSKVEKTLATLSSRIQPQQSLFLTMESAPLEACGGAKGHATDADIAALQYEYLRLAVSNPRVIGLLAFGFWTSGDGPAQLPLTVRAHEYIWSQIPKPAPPAPPPPPPAPPAPTPPPPPPPARAVPVRIVSEQLRVGRRGPLAVGLSCPKADTAACAGSVSLRLLGDDPRPIGASEFSIDPGEGAAVELKIGRRLRGSLLHLARGRSKGRVRVSAATVAGKSTSVLTLTPRAS